MATSKQILDAILELTKTVNTVDKNVAVQKSELKNLAKHVEELKQEQIRQNEIVEEHERRSTASEGRQNMLEEQHHLFKIEHEVFKARLKFAEKPSLVLRNIWKGLLALGAGAASALGIMKFFDLLKWP